MPEQIHETAEFSNEIGCEVDEDILFMRLTEICIEQQHYTNLFKMSEACASSHAETAKLLHELVVPLYDLIPVMLKRLHSTFLAPAVHFLVQTPL